jgi:hypothetical protein
MPYGYTTPQWNAMPQAERTKAAQTRPSTSPQKVGGGGVGGSSGVGVRRPGTAAPGAAPAAPQPGVPGAGGGAASAAGGPSAPPEVRDLEIKAEVDPRLSGYADRYGEHLTKLETGKTREADVLKGQLDSDMERQVAQARESALAAGQPWTAQDEERMRSELKRGQYGSMAEFELGSQRQQTEALQGGLGIMKAPFESQLAEKGFSQGTQKMLMDYALGRGGLVSEDKRTAVMEAGQSIDAYKAFLSMLGGPSLDFSSSY